jgi:hypothetical protein
MNIYHFETMSNTYGIVNNFLKGTWRGSQNLLLTTENCATVHDHRPSAPTLGTWCTAPWARLAGHLVGHLTHPDRLPVVQPFLRAFPAVFRLVLGLSP